MNKLLKGKVALVTGCDRGIGLSICRSFAREGAIVYANILNELSKDTLVEFDSQLKDGNIIPVCFDITDKKLIIECIKKIKLEQNGKLDILVNNAGVKYDGLVEMVNDRSINSMLNVNVIAAIHMTQAALRLLKHSDCASIVNVSSIVGEYGNIGQSIYGASKSAVASLTKSWAKELAPKQIRVNAVAPGSIDTDMFYTIDEKTMEKSIAAIGMRRLGKPDEVANVILFLVSDLSSYVTGEIIGINGGLFI